jgi:hypothetical protein
MDDYVKKLTESLTECDFYGAMDLILDGGAFNGSYHVGVLYYISNLEDKQKIVIKRVSTCSIGSIVGLLFLIKKLNCFEEVYQMIMPHFKQTALFEKVLDLGSYLEKHIPDNVLQLVNKRLFITYYNILKSRKIVKCTFKSKHELLECIIKSCFLPFIMNGNVFYKGRFFDGLTPYLLPRKQKINRMYIDLYGTDKISNVLNIKNEKSNIHRVFIGALDVHLFFMKGYETQMCSYVNDWGIVNNLKYQIKMGIETIVYYLLLLIYMISKYLNHKSINKYKSGFLKRLLHFVYMEYMNTYNL